LKYEAENKISATVKSVRAGDIMSVVTFDVTEPCEMTSVITTESVGLLGLEPGDEVKLVIRAVNVVPAKD